ncbi:MAG: hypothetical protein MUC81_14070 [Bacteroidia bacterium]|jgi:hypothetical protein|nr:hypothetical protein [Bacteroidia bacterium]
MRITNFSKKLILILGILFFPALLMLSCNDEGSEVKKETNYDGQGLNYNTTGNLIINIIHLFNENNLTRGNKYVTDALDTISVNSLKYYVSNVQLKKSNGEWTNLKTYNLIDIEDPASLSNTISGIPAENYTKLKFNVGIDSAMNRAGVQDGDLSPLNDMFWSWTADFIFFRIKGNYSTNKAMTLDIGGNQHLMTVEVDLTTIKQSNQTNSITLAMNVANIFNKPNKYDLKTMSTDIHTANNADLPKLTQNINTSVFTLSLNK